MFARFARLSALSVGASAIVCLSFYLIWGPTDFLVKWFAMFMVFSSLAVGFCAGELISTMRSARWRPTRVSVLVVLVIVVLASLSYLIGALGLAPTIGNSESRFVFPGFFLIGTVVGSLRASGRQ